MSVSASRQRLAVAATLSCLAAAIVLSARAEIPFGERRSAYEDMSRDNKAMQDDDTANPGMLAALDGEALWQTRMGSAGQVVRRLPRRRDGEDEGRGCPLSGL